MADFLECDSRSCIIKSATMGERRDPIEVPNVYWYILSLNLK